ncbi:MAG: DUF1003 domain-containing protein [Alphaproteobacteria bacterium]|jgi:uncharacterized membrane protein|nr:MAG: DUF1003 domain-containing protein [Alphaproteobacteria bacterium]
MIDIREQLAHDLLGCSYGELSGQKKSVIDLIADQRPTDVSGTLKDSTWWERLADSVARVGGSWSFIIGFSSALAIWIASNVVLAASGRAFDPFPFIFLNLILSMVAALQAPVIMMSQNRQSAKDRAAAEHDYIVNLRAELEIMLLHDKLDSLRDQDTMGRLDVLGQKIDDLTKDLAGRA